MIKNNTKSPKAIDIKAGKKVKNRRKALEMSMDYLADRIGKTQQQLQKYETAKDRISLSVASDIAKTLRINIILTMDGDILFMEEI